MNTYSIEKNNDYCDIHQADANIYLFVQIQKPDALQKRRKISTFLSQNLKFKIVYKK